MFWLATKNYFLKTWTPILMKNLPRKKNCHNYFSESKYKIGFNALWSHIFICFKILLFSYGLP
jgi:hypothetical protein